MKKLISAASITLLGVGSAVAHDIQDDMYWNPNIDLRNLSATVNVGFESQYVFRGSVQADESLQTSIDLSLPVYGGDLGFGAWNNNDLRSQSSSHQINDDEIDLYVTYMYPITDEVNAEFGYTHYWYPDNADGNVTSTNEISLGFSTEYYALWGATLYYDFDLEQTTFELSSGYSYNLEDFGMPKTSIDLSAYFGVINTREVNGSDDKNGYSYGGANVDVVYVLNEITSLSIGARFAANNDDTGPANGLASASSSEESLWWGAALSMGF